MDKTTDAYMSLTNVVTRKIKRSIVFIVIMTIGAGIFGALVPGGFIPEEDMGYFYVNIQLPDASSLSRTNDGVIIAEVDLNMCQQIKDKWGFTMTGRHEIYAKLLTNFVKPDFEPQIVRKSKK